MNTMLVRGIPPKIRREIQQMADAENLSVNQLLIRMIKEAVEASKKQKGIEELREQIYRKYGLHEDSTKLIREDRDR